MLRMRSYKPLAAAAVMAFAAAGMGMGPALAHAGAHENSHKSGAEKAAQSPAIVATKHVMRDLWIGHVFWVRAVVDAHLEGNAKAEQAAEAEVVANAKALAGALRPFYGAAAEDGLFQLLAGHYGAIKAYLVAAKQENDGKQEKAVEELLSNAAQIADFLAGANPYLPSEAVLPLLQAHGGHHLTQIQELLAGDYAGEAKTWHAMSQHMYVISDAIVDALAKQFPEKF